ncbi:MAG: MFS transporter, partial [Acidiferrobacteraceae bacterium]
MMIHDKGPTRSLASLLALTAGATVANLYYSQPLLAVMGTEFHRTANVMGLVPMLTQMGYAAGLALLVPLGDSHERRRLMVVMTLLVAVALLAVGYSPTFRWLLAASFLLGLLTIVPQLVVPYAAHLVPAQTRGRFVGQVMSGLLIGIIL